MVVIRLARGGAKKRPFYHVVAIDSRHARNSGKYIERLGYFNPVARGAEVRLHLDHERITHWVSQGAQPSERVRDLLVESGKVAAGSKTTTQKRKIKQADKLHAKTQAKAAELKAAEKAAAAAAKAAEKAASEAEKAAPDAEQPAPEAENTSES